MAQLVDLDGLNKVYKVNKERIDNIKKEIFEEDKGSSCNPVYIEDEKIQPLVKSGDTEMNLGPESVTDVYFGKDGSSVNASLHSKSLHSETIKLSDKVTMEYDSSITEGGALVFKFN